MTSPAAFWPQALPWAQQAHAATGVLTSVILSQWAEETEYGGYDWTVEKNPGNVGSFDGEPLNNMPTLADGVEAYIQCMELAYYSFVRKAVGYVNQCLALGASPWASAHYEAAGGPPGEDLIKIIQDNGLTRYDGVQPSVPVVQPVVPYVPTTNPVPAGGVFMIPTGCTDAGAVRAQIREWWDTWRSDTMTAGDQNLFQLVFYEPAASGGYAGNPDLLLAGIIDGGKTAGTLRPQWVNAV